MSQKKQNDQHQVSVIEFAIFRCKTMKLFLKLSLDTQYTYLPIMGNDHLTKIQLIEIVFFQLIESLIMNLYIFDHLIELFNMFSVDRNFKITQNDTNKSFDQLTKKN